MIPSFLLLLPCVLAVALVLLVLLLPFALPVAAGLCEEHGAWRWLRAFGRTARHVYGAETGDVLAFQWEVSALRESGKIGEAADLARARLGEKGCPAWSRNVAIDVLISAGEYSTALRAEPPSVPANARDANVLALIQVNLAEAEYNLGRWEAAEERLRPLDLACRNYPIARAGLLQQRLSRRISSKRNVLFLRAQLAAARGDWSGAERLCHEAVQHGHRGQGGSGILLWAQALKQLGCLGKVATRAEGLARRYDLASLNRQRRASCE